MRVRAAGIVAILLLGPRPAPADPLGRLLLTPAQRAALDRQHELPRHAGRGAERFTLDGRVERSDGKGILWINGQPVPGTAPLPDSLAGLKVGEGIDLATGERIDPLGGGRLSVHRPRQEGRP